MAKPHCSLLTAGDGSYVQQQRQDGGGSTGGRPPRVSFRQPTRKPGGSSWDAKEAGGGRSADADYLYELGASQQ